MMTSTSTETAGTSFVKITGSPLSTWHKKKRGFKMNELQVFNYGEQKIRTVMIDAEPWWVLADVCKVLELGNPSQLAARRLDEDERQTVASNIILNDIARGGKGWVIVNESGLYKTILRSDKPAAKEFTRWVTHEVLPAIRQTGTYQARTPDTDVLRQINELDALCAEVEKRKVELSRVLVDGTKLSYELSRVLFNYLQGQYTTAKDKIPLAYPPQESYFREVKTK
jgi:prophage antirepressor-like protein